MLCAVAVTLLLAEEPPALPPSRFDVGPRQALLAARERWEKAGLTNYQFTVEIPCHPCPPTEYRVTVRNGKVASAYMIAESWTNPNKPFKPKPVPNTEWKRNFLMTIPELFDATESILRDMRFDSHASYDERYGFPNSLFYIIASMEFFPKEGHGGFYVVDFRPGR